MSFVNITNVIVDNNPAPFLSQLKFHITFECLKEISDVIQWKLVYIGSAKDQLHDQIIDCFEMGPLSAGIMQFIIESNPPDFRKIPKQDLLDVTAVIISVTYRKMEFFRVGYYIHNEYIDPLLVENPPEELQIDKIVRKILAEKPRITRMAIPWGETAPVMVNIPASSMEVEDPFATSNGAFQQLDQMKTGLDLSGATSYSYGMFTSGESANPPAQQPWQ